MSEKGNTLLQLPDPPYFAVIFTSILSGEEEPAYHAMADRMLKLAAHQPGFLGYESAREASGISVSYWESLEAIQHWKQHADHLKAQQKGKDSWYAAYTIRICKVERAYAFQQ